MIRPLAYIGATALVASLPSAASAQQLVQRRDLSYAMALAIATGAIDACKALGLTTAAAVVVDRAAARRKAYTSRTFGITTTEFQKEIPARQSRRDQTLLPNVTGLNGGVPIKLGNEVIAGVGVAGSPGKDEECAIAGLEKVRQALQ